MWLGPDRHDSADLRAPPRAFHYPKGTLPGAPRDHGDLLFTGGPANRLHFVKQSDSSGAAHYVALELLQSASGRVTFGVFATPLYKLAFDPPRRSSNIDYRKDFAGTIDLHLRKDGSLAPLGDDFEAEVKRHTHLPWLAPFLRATLEPQVGTIPSSTHLDLGAAPTSLTAALKADRSLRDLRNLDFAHIRHACFEAYSTGRLVTASLFDEWTRDPQPNKLRISGAVILAKVSGEWAILFGKRDENPAKPFPGFMTVPVGKADEEFSPLLRALEVDDVRRLLSLGILRHDDYQDNLESVSEACSRETYEETGILVHHQSLVGRLDDYLCLGGRGLVSLFVHVLDPDDSQEPLTTKELPAYAWLPLDLLVRAEETTFLTAVDENLRQQMFGERVEIIPELRQIALGNLRSFTRNVLGPWMGLE